MGLLKRWIDFREDVNDAARTGAKVLRRREEHASERNQFAMLSEREQEILRLIAAGYSSVEIGGQLSISPKTVDTYKQRVNGKIGLARRSDYVCFAMKLGLLDA
jgi:DNA-binding NarL/FixJ family response regulator